MTRYSAERSSFLDITFSQKVAEAILRIELTPKLKDAARLISEVTKPNEFGNDYNITWNKRIDYFSNRYLRIYCILFEFDNDPLVNINFIVQNLIHVNPLRSEKEIIALITNSVDKFNLPITGYSY